MHGRAGELIGRAIQIGSSRIFIRGEPTQISNTRKNYMANWKKQIRGCFGNVDHKFANYPSDRKRAAKMLGDAIEQGVSYKEYCKGIKDWLRKQLQNADAQTAKDILKSEMKKVRKISTYFP